MTTLNYILAGAGLAIMILIFILLRLKKKPVVDLPPIDLNEPASWTEEEVSVFERISKHRVDSGFSPLFFNDELKVLSQGRVKFWINRSTPKEELHHYWLGHAQIYRDKGYERIDENAQLGYVRIFYMFKTSEDHNASMLNPNNITGAITIRKDAFGKNRTCLILAT